MEIKGKYNTAICYTNFIEESAFAQIKEMCDQKFCKDSKIRIMPDVHSGKGCCIGTTMTIEDKVVPNIVGVDIGCGMYTVKLGKIDLDLQKLDNVIHNIPCGKRVWKNKSENFDLMALNCYRELKDANRLQRSLGTLGGGNHFIEIDVSSAGEKYLVVHSGSRNLGTQVADYYQNLAIDLHLGKYELFSKKEKLIKEYKEQGKKAEINDALKQLEKSFKPKKPTIPAHLCYLYGKYFNEYMHDVDICQKFAVRNREKIAEIILQQMGLQNLGAFHTIHNYIDVKEKILRKGSISAKKKEKVLIPINMRDGSILAVGKGNKEWNYSAPHGAGRVISRIKAKETLDLKEYKKSMKGIFSTTVSKATLDEAPMAYKSLKDIIKFVTDSVDIIEILKPIYNFKAED